MGNLSEGLLTMKRAPEAAANHKDGVAIQETTRYACPSPGCKKRSWTGEDWLHHIRTTINGKRPSCKDLRWNLNGHNGIKDEHGDVELTTKPTVHDEILTVCPAYNCLAKLKYCAKSGKLQMRERRRLTNQRLINRLIRPRIRESEC